MKKHTITLLTLIIAALTLITHVSSQEGAKVRLKMASGFSGGTYDKMATALSAIPGLEVSNRTTTGSEENLQLVKQKLADVAFVQTDAYKSAKLKDRNLRSKVKMLFPVFSEELHLIVNKKVKTLDRLKGAKVSIGALNSGTAVTSKIVLQILNVKYPATSAASLQNMSTADALKKVQTGEIAAMFLVSGSPVAKLKGLNASVKSNIRLYSFDVTETDLLTDNYFYYKNAIIPSSDYPWVDSDVKTVAVETLIVVRNDLDDDQVRFLINGIYGNQLELSEKHVKWKDVDFRQIVKFKARTKMVDYHPAVYGAVDELAKKL